MRSLNVGGSSGDMRRRNCGDVEFAVKLLMEVATDLDAEAAGLADQIRVEPRCEDGRPVLRDQAVLCRSHTYLARFALRLESLGIPVLYRANDQVCPRAHGTDPRPACADFVHRPQGRAETRRLVARCLHFLNTASRWPRKRCAGRPRIARRASGTGTKRCCAGPTRISHVLRCGSNPLVFLSCISMISSSARRSETCLR